MKSMIICSNACGENNFIGSTVALVDTMNDMEICNMHLRSAKKYFQMNLAQLAKKDFTYLYIKKNNSWNNFHVASPVENTKKATSVVRESMACKGIACSKIQALSGQFGILKVEFQPSTSFAYLIQYARHTREGIVILVGSLHELSTDWYKYVRGPTLQSAADLCGILLKAFKHNINGPHFFVKNLVSSAVSSFNWSLNENWWPTILTFNYITSAVSKNLSSGEVIPRVAPEVDRENLHAWYIQFASFSCKQENFDADAPSLVLSLLS